ncbi:retrovirus-related pol polyprotein from transposon TNT 1-94 [Tanacetum coccineum]
MSTPVNTSSTDSQMHNNIMAQVEDLLPMLGPGRYSQWRSRFLQYIDTKPNGGGLKKSILSGPYMPTTVQVQAVEAAEGRPAVPQHTSVETILNMTPENKEHFQSEKEAISSFNHMIPEQAQRDKDMQKNLALLAKYFKKLNKPTTTTLRILQTPGTRLKIPHQVGSQAMQQTGIQCFNCKGYGHYAKECRKPKRLEDTDEEIDEQELEAHYSYMAKIQEVSPEESSSTGQPLEQKLILVTKGKSVETQFDKPSVVRQPNAQRIPKPSVLGKPTPFSNSPEMRSFQTNQSVNKTNASDGLFKPVTQQNLPQNRNQAVRNTNVLKPGMYRIASTTTQTRTPQLPHASRNTNPHMSKSSGVIHTTSVSRPQLKCYQVKDKVVPNNSQVKFQKKEVEDHHRISNISKKTKSVTACNDSSNSKTSNVNAICAECENCVFNSNHDACVSRYLKDVNARTKKPNVVPISASKPKRKANKSVATPHKKTVASDTTIQKSKSYYKELYENTNQEWKWWIAKRCPSGYTWTQKPLRTKKIWMPKIRKDDESTSISPTIDIVSRITNIVQLILFIVDSGCTKHMTGNLKLLCNFVEKFLGTVRFGNDQFAPILGYGDLIQGNVTIKRVYYVEGLNHNLFSVGQFCDADLEVAFRKSTCFVRDLQGNDLLTGSRGSDLYTISLQETTSSTPICFMAKASPTQAWLWHRRLSHLNFDYITLLSKKEM